MPGRACSEASPDAGSESRDRDGDWRSCGRPFGQHHRQRLGQDGGHHRGGCRRSVCRKPGAEERATEKRRHGDAPPLQDRQRHDAEAARLRRHVPPRRQGRRGTHYVQARPHASGEGRTGGDDAARCWVRTRHRLLRLSDSFPRRIVCLTEEPTEVLYAIGQADRIVGISGFTVRPARARREKPKVSAFTSARIDDIVRLEPDLAIGFSDIQADIAQALIKRGGEVWISNHRSVAGILAYVRRLGAMVGAWEQSERYARELAAHIALVREAAAVLPRRPRIYFEEWDEPQISAIRWVSELIDVAGGCDVFPERAAASLGKDRIVADPQEVVRAAP